MESPEGAGRGGESDPGPPNPSNKPQPLPLPIGPLLPGPGDLQVPPEPVGPTQSWGRRRGPGRRLGNVRGPGSGNTDCISSPALRAPEALLTAFLGGGEGFRPEPPTSRGWEWGRGMPGPEFGVWRGDPWGAMLPACSRVGFVRPSGETRRNDKGRKGVWGSGLSWGFGEVMAHAPELLVLQGSGVRAAQLPHIWKGRCEGCAPSSASLSSWGPLRTNILPRVCPP